MLSAQGMDWAKIADLVGNRSPKLLADTYTHVLMDERELNYESLIAETPRRRAQWPPGVTDEPRSSIRN